MRQSGIKVEYIIDFCRERISISKMPPRRCADPPVANRAMEREMRELHARMDAMETKQRRALNVGDVSEA